MAEDSNGAQRQNQGAQTQARPADKRSDADKAQDEARAAQQKADEAAANASEAEKSAEQREADKAARDADDARARAAHAEREERLGKEAKPTSAADAGVIVPGGVDVPAGHHRAVKRANDPSNPAPSHPDHENPELMTEKLVRTSLDAVEGLVTTFVHPDMVGDYLRAGWSRAQIA